MSTIDERARAAFEASHKFYGTTPLANAWQIPCVRDYWRAIVKAIDAVDDPLSRRRAFVAAAGNGLVCRPKG